MKNMYMYVKINISFNNTTLYLINILCTIYFVRGYVPKESPHCHVLVSLLCHDRKWKLCHQHSGRQSETYTSQPY